MSFVNVLHFLNNEDKIWFYFLLVYLLLVSFARFGLLTDQSFYVYACLHTGDEEMDDYPSNEDDDNGDGSDKEMDGYPICTVNIPSI